MNYTRFLISLILFLGASLSACQSSTVEPDSQATQVADAVEATLTAQIPEPSDTPPPTETPTPLPTATSTATPTPGPMTATQIFDLISPAIAFIDTPAGTGSGVLTEGGYLVTNAHVVWPFKEVRVVFPDGSEHLQAPVLAWDMVADLAVVGPLETSITPVALVSQEESIIGEDIYLIGYPGEVEDFPQPTITRGLVSRLREWEQVGMTYFQVDATITGGQSGGVLASTKGEVLGISGYSFSKAKFGLVASTADVLPRLEQLIAGQEPVGFSERRIAQEGGQLKHDFTLHNSWEVTTFILDEPAETEVEFKVKGDNDPGLAVFDVFGDNVSDTKEGTRRTLNGSVTTEVEAPYFVELFQYAEEPGEFEISSSHKLIRYEDPDDNIRLDLDQTVEANLDAPADTDYFVIELEAEETIQVTVDSVLVDPWVGIYPEGGREEEFVSDDDSGGGIFGLSAQLIYKAPRQGNYLIVVSDSDYLWVGGYFLNVIQAPPDATPTAPEFTSTTVSTAFGSMAKYQSSDYPLTMLYPANWTEPSEDIPLCRSVTICFIGEGVGNLAIAEDDFRAVGLGGISLDEYAEATLNLLKKNSTEFELVSRERITTLQDLPAEIITFSFNQGLFKGSRLIYVYDEGEMAFNATYLTGTSGYERLESLIDYSFRTFRVWKPGQEEKDPVFHLDEGVRLLGAEQEDAAIDAFTEALKLDPEFVEAYTERAEAYRATGDLDKALADSSKAIELKADDARLYYSRSMIHWLREDYPPAIADMDQAIQFNSEYVAAYNLRALIQATQGNHEAALKDIEKAISVQAAEEISAPLLDTRGYIYLKMEEYDQAKADYEAIFDQGLEFPYALLGGGLTYAALGETDKALELIEEGLAKAEDIKTPDPQMADLMAMAKERLAQLQAEETQK